MLSDITIGQYYKENSFVHKLDARMKIILTILLIVMIFICKNFYSLVLMIAIIFLSIAVSKVPFKMFFKSLKPIVPVVIFTAFINIFYSDDSAGVIEFWILKIPVKGLYTAVFLSLIHI